MWYGEAQELSLFFLLYLRQPAQRPSVYFAQSCACLLGLGFHLGLRVFCKERKMVRGDFELPSVRKLADLRRQERDLEARRALKLQVVLGGLGSEFLSLHWVISNDR